MGRRGSRKQRVGEGVEAIGDREVAFEIWEEDRRDTRFSMTTRMAYLRLPRRMPAAEKRRQVAAFRTWLGEAAAKRPDLLDARRLAAFAPGHTYALGWLHARLAIARSDRKTASGRVVGGEATAASPLRLSLKLPADLPDRDAAAAVERLLYRLAAKHQLPRVERLLDAANDAHFRVAVGRIKLSPTTSRWGSCSSAGNINLSSRLLGAPESCLRAVIVHELAHRLEMNHGERFWRLVYDAMPEYGEADRWLKEHGRDLKWREVAAVAPH